MFCFQRILYIIKVYCVFVHIIRFNKYIILKPCMYVENYYTYTWAYHIWETMDEVKSKIYDSASFGEKKSINLYILTNKGCIFMSAKSWYIRRILLRCIDIPLYTWIKIQTHKDMYWYINLRCTRVTNFKEFIYYHDIYRRVVPSG